MAYTCVQQKNKESMLKQACSLIHTQPCAQATMSFTALHPKLSAAARCRLSAAVAAYTETLCASHVFKGPGTVKWVAQRGQQAN